MTISPLVYSPHSYVYRFFALNEESVTSPWVVMEDHTHFRLAGYAGPDARVRALAKATALAEWAVTVGNWATVAEGAPTRHAQLEQAMAVSPLPS